MKKGEVATVSGRTYNEHLLLHAQIPRGNLQNGRVQREKDRRSWVGLWYRLSWAGLSF